MHEDEIPVGKAEDLRGKTYNRLTVLYRVKNNGKKVRWKCQCECGNTTIVEKANLTSGHTKSCGCYKTDTNKKNLIGQKFGRLTVLKDSGQRDNERQVMWECECECGNIILVPTRRLTYGTTKSCGCYHKDIISYNLVGQRFGKLLVIEPTDERSSSGAIMWKCQCDCGNEHIISTNHLMQGAKSCGCITSAVDLTGKRFGKLVALEPTDQRSGSFVVWKCQCDCGNITYASVGNLNAGHVKSCGCLSKLNLTNKRFGKLVALEPTNERRGTSVVWKCQCDCGNVAYVEATHLNTGITKSCGCLTNAVDLTGQVFGKLIAIKPTEKRVNSQVVWELQCECGNIAYATVGNLKSGHTKSCGCITNAIDLTGQRFGKLTAIKPTDKRSSSGSIIWECKCDCGNLAYVPANSLNYGETNSCGCLTSKGEMIITNILQSYNIIHEVQKTFDTCRFIDTNSKARFDFFVDNEYLIEFDGSQHFFARGIDWNTEEKFQKTQEHDAYKNQWCKDNNIPLIRIPYTKLNTLCIEDLLLETTQFRVV